MHKQRSTYWRTECRRRMEIGENWKTSFSVSTSWCLILSFVSFASKVMWDEKWANQQFVEGSLDVLFSLRSGPC